MLLAQVDKREFLRGMSEGIHGAKEQSIDIFPIAICIILIGLLIILAIALKNKYKIRSVFIRLKKRMKGNLVPSDRFKVKADVTIELPDTPHEKIRSVITNLSRHGMFIKLNPPAPIETEIKFYLFLSGDITISGVAEVKWVQNGWSEHHPSGMGVKFIDMTQENENQIRLWLQRNKPKKET